MDKDFHMKPIRHMYSSYHGAVARLAGACAGRRGTEAAARLRSRLSPE